MDHGCCSGGARTKSHELRLQRKDGMWKTSCSSRVGYYTSWKIWSVCRPKTKITEQLGFSLRNHKTSNVNRTRGGEGARNAKKDSRIKPTTYSALLADLGCLQKYNSWPTAGPSTLTYRLEDISDGRPLPHSAQWDKQTWTRTLDIILAQWMATTSIYLSNKLVISAEGASTWAARR